MNGESFHLALLEGAALSLFWSGIGLAAWWIMFRAPLGQRCFRARMEIAAPPEKVWSACLLEPSPPGGWSGALDIERQGFEVSGLGDAPPVWHKARVRHGGDGAFLESVWRVTRYAPGALYEGVQISMGGKTADAGARMTLRLAQKDGGTVLEQETRRRVRGVFGHLYGERACRRFLDHVRAHCEESDARERRTMVSRGASLALAVVAFVTFVGLFSLGNPEMLGVAAFVAFFLQAALWLHEYGHLLAMRWFGHRDACLVIIPLLGGTAINVRRARSRFEEAMVALMGPALSGAVVLLLTPVAPWGFEFFADSLLAVEMDWSDPRTLRVWAGLCAIVFLGVSIPINLYNLMPIGLLDGGRVIGALACGGPTRALLGCAVFAALGYALAGSAGAEALGAGMAFVAVIWAAAHLTAEKGADALPPMSGREAFTTIALLVVTLAIYVDASRSFTPAVVEAVRSGIARSGVVSEEPASAAQEAAP